MRLTAKIGLTIAGILLFAITVTTLLNFYKYQSTLGELVRSRFEVVVGDLRTQLEHSIGLGLRLSEIKATQDLLDRVREADDQILSIEVFQLSASGGSALFLSGDAGERQLNAPLPPRWLERSGPSGDREGFWHEEDGMAVLVGATLVNSFNRPVGGIVLRYPESLLDEKVETMFARLSTFGLGVFAVMAGLAFLAVIVLFRPISRSFERMIQSAHLLYERGEPPITPNSAENAEEAAYAVFHNQAKKVIDEVLQADDDVYQLEHQTLSQIEGDGKGTAS